MTEKRADLAAVVAKTLADYDAHAKEFWDGTRDHDVRQNLDALLRAIDGTPPHAILDLGCGPGRDLLALTERGHVATGIDGAARFVEMARSYSGCDVWQQDFLALDLPAGRFDGVFANATLQHVPSAALPRVLRELHATLKPRGVLFASIPHGQGEEGWNRGRYCVYHAALTWTRYASDAGFTLLDEYYRPSGVPRERQPWLVTVWRRTD